MNTSTKSLALVIAIATAALLINNAYARNRRGPYILAGVSLMNINYDTNVRLKKKIGNDLEPAPTFTFGWDLTDELGLEMVGKYVNSKTDTVREHIIEAATSVVYHPQITPLSKRYIQPTIKLGPILHIAALPGDPDTNNRYIATYGVGGHISCGVFVLYKHLYAGLELQNSFLEFKDKYQTINNKNQKIYDGGLKHLIGGHATIGIHF